MPLAPPVQVNYVCILPDTPPFDPIFVDDGGDVGSTIETAEVWAAAGVGGDDTLLRAESELPAKPMT